MAAESAPAFLALRERACVFVAEHGPVEEAALLAHVYSGAAPAALRAQLAAPLAADPRLEHTEDGRWALRHRPVSPAWSDSPGVSSGGDVAVTTLAVAATSSNPQRGRLVRVAAVRVQAGTAVARFMATVNPGRRVPRYVAARLGLETDVLDDMPPFAAILDELTQFLAPGAHQRVIVAQDARQTWAMLAAEAGRAGCILAEPALVDANQLATRVLDLERKPSLALVAAQLGISSVRIGQPEEEARVLSLVATELLTRDRALMSLRALLATPSASWQGPLLRPATAKALADEPGVYVMRGADHQPLYVGKARRLRARVSDYIHRPLGATRRLEGLVDAVEAVEPTLCATELEALVLEDRQIHRLQPRFNTARQQRLPRLWIRLPPPPARRPGQRQLSPRRLEPSLGPTVADGEFVGPFGTETTAQKVRGLARSVFQLDAWRAADPVTYEAQLQSAWAFLHGQTDGAKAHLRPRAPAALRRAMLELDVPALLLPADPRYARYAVLRPRPGGLEALLIDRAIFSGYARLGDDDDLTQLAAALLAPAAPRTAPDDSAVVLRWLGAQRPPARLVWLPDDPQAAADLVEDASASVLASGAGET